MKIYINIYIFLKNPNTSKINEGKWVKENIHKMDFIPTFNHMTIYSNVSVVLVFSVIMIEHWGDILRFMLKHTEHSFSFKIFE